ncbi:MAG: M15 family metallopeptidase [Oscillospiraceae bacterium]|nr:M15 family metallopeptidase [Oscillospiraceae bacterium]
MKTEYRNDVTMDPSGFVLLADFVPHIIQEIRYYSTYNFIGERIDGYEEPCALLTREAARALRAVSGELFVQGYRLKVFDAYRPACAVRSFVLWGLEDQDIRMKPYFYPELDKTALFAEGYIAKRSSHCRGSTVDLTLLDMKTGKEVDMGGPFDYFGELSHPGFRGVTDEQYANRMLLQRAMVRAGFAPYDCEWWHFTLKNEPYPDTYFEFPVSSAYLRRG